MAMFSRLLMLLTNRTLIKINYISVNGGVYWSSEPNQLLPLSMLLMYKFKVIDRDGKEKVIFVIRVESIYSRNVTSVSLINKLLPKAIVSEYWCYYEGNPDTLILDDKEKRRTSDSIRKRLMAAKINVLYPIRPGYGKDVRLNKKEDENVSR